MPDLLEGIKLRFTHPKEIVAAPDTGRVAIGLGNPLFGEIFFPFIKRKTRIGALANYSQGNDYRRYTSYSGSGSLAVPLAKLAGSYNRKIRERDYYETKSLTIVAGELSDNQKIGLSATFSTNWAKYFYNNLSYLNYYFSSISYHHQTFFGKLAIEPELIYQTRTPTTLLFSVSNLILFKNLSYLKPGFGYFLNENKFFTKSEAGIFLGSFVFLLRFITQQPNLLRFDSLYSDPGLFRVNFDLAYPFTRRKIAFGILFRGIEFNLAYVERERYISYSLADSLLIPINSPKLRQLGLSLKKDFTKFQNNLLVVFNYDSLSLVPSYLIYDSVTLSFKPIVFKVNAKILGARYFEKRRLNPALIFSPEFGYQDRFNKRFNYRIGLRIENLFNNKYELYPERFDSGFRLVIQALITKPL